MHYLHRGDLKLAYEDAGRGALPILLIHGFAGNHTHLRPQFDFFRRDHRVVAVDRRGHGASDKPEQVYSIDGFADDLAWMCRELGLYRPVAIVHSQGGIALELAGRYPDLLSGVILLDAPCLTPPDKASIFDGLLAGLRGADYRAALRGFAEGAVFLPTDDPARKTEIIESMCALPQHVLVSTWENYLSFDDVQAAARCPVPVLAIGGIFATDPTRLRATCSQVSFGQTVGAGHFIQLEVPDQVNAMVERFLAVGLAQPSPVLRTNGGR
jgi:pimeloyl-ACP methyl ester carboxylesterase